MVIPILKQNIIIITVNQKPNILVYHDLAVPASFKPLANINQPKIQ
jgi:hypothetical protein